MEKMDNMTKVKSAIQPELIGRLISSLFVVSLLGTLANACAAGVGDPCVPEQIPTNQSTLADGTTTTLKGFVSNESYIEAGSVQCETRVCGVFNLVGDPSDSCKDSESQGLKCPTRATIDEKVYCTCRCKAPSKDFAVCECPSGYECQEVLTQGEIGVRGSYCVRAGSYANVAR